MATRPLKNIRFGRQKLSLKFYIDGNGLTAISQIAKVSGEDFLITAIKMS